MKRIALTGSIASGKSEAVKIIRALGIPVFDADLAVHELYADGTAAAHLSPAFKPAVIAGKVDRKVLSALLLAQPALFKELEAAIHPLVHRKEKDFFRKAKSEGHALAVADIPLLFEGHRENDFDLVIFVDAPENVRRLRALSRPGMIQEKLDAIIARQLPDNVKRQRADIVIANNGSLEDLAATTRDVFNGIQSGKAHS